MKVWVIVLIYKGILDSVTVYGSEDEARAHLKEWLDEYGFSSWEEYHESASGMDAGINLEEVEVV